MTTAAVILTNTNKEIFKNWDRTVCDATKMHQTLIDTVDSVAAPALVLCALSSPISVPLILAVSFMYPVIPAVLIATVALRQLSAFARDWIKEQVIMQQSVAVISSGEKGSVLRLLGKIQDMAPRDMFLRLRNQVAQEVVDQKKTDLVNELFIPLRGHGKGNEEFGSSLLEQAVAQGNADLAQSIVSSNPSCTYSKEFLQSVFNKEPCFTPLMETCKKNYEFRGSVFELAAEKQDLEQMKQIARNGPVAPSSLDSLSHFNRVAKGDAYESFRKENIDEWKKLLEEPLSSVFEKQSVLVLTDVDYTDAHGNIQNNLKQMIDSGFTPVIQTSEWGRQGEMAESLCDQLDQKKHAISCLWLQHSEFFNDSREGLLRLLSKLPEDGTVVIQSPLDLPLLDGFFSSESDDAEYFVQWLSMQFPKLHILAPKLGNVEGFSTSAILHSSNPQDVRFSLNDDMTLHCYGGKTIYTAKGL